MSCCFSCVNGGLIYSILYLQDMRVANSIVKEPMVLGHECAGIIEEVGGEVKHLVVGDRVALEPGISCSRCNICKDGRYNLCGNVKFFSSPPFNGALANQVIEFMRFFSVYGFYYGYCRSICLCMRWSNVDVDLLTRKC